MLGGAASCLSSARPAPPLMLAVEPSPRMPPRWAVSGSKVTPLRVPSAKFTRASQLAAASGRSRARDHPSACTLESKSIQHDGPLVGVVKATLAAFERAPSPPAPDIAGFAAAIDALALQRPRSRTSTKHDPLATTALPPTWAPMAGFEHCASPRMPTHFHGVGAEATGFAEFHAAFAACDPVAWSSRDESIHAQQDLGRVDRRIGRDDCLLVRSKAIGGGCVPAPNKRGRECRERLTKVLVGTAAAATTRGGCTGTSHCRTTSGDGTRGDGAQAAHDRSVRHLRHQEPMGRGAAATAGNRLSRGARGPSRPWLPCRRGSTRSSACRRVAWSCRRRRAPSDTKASCARRSGWARGTRRG